MAALSPARLSKCCTVSPGPEGPADVLVGPARLPRAPLRESFQSFVTRDGRVTGCVKARSSR